MSHYSRHRPITPRCPRCGYSLESTPACAGTLVCSECGSRSTLRDATAPKRIRFRYRWSIPLLLLLVASLSLWMAAPRIGSILPTAALLFLFDHRFAIGSFTPGDELLRRLRSLSMSPNDHQNMVRYIQEHVGLHSRNPRLRPLVIEAYRQAILDLPTWDIFLSSSISTDAYVYDECPSPGLRSLLLRTRSPVDILAVVDIANRVDAIDERAITAEQSFAFQSTFGQARWESGPDAGFVNIMPGCYCTAAIVNSDGASRPVVLQVSVFAKPQDRDTPFRAIAHQRIKVQDVTQYVDGESRAGSVLDDVKIQYSGNGYYYTQDTGLRERRVSAISIDVKNKPTAIKVVWKEHGRVLASEVAVGFPGASAVIVSRGDVVTATRFGIEALCHIEPWDVSSKAAPADLIIPCDEKRYLLRGSY